MEEKEARTSNTSTGMETPLKVYLGGLPLCCTVQDLRDYFSKFGPVQDACLNYNKSGLPRGCGCVLFGNLSCIQKKKVMGTTHHIRGKKVEVRKYLDCVNARHEQLCEENMRSIHVCGFHQNTSNDDLWKCFEQFGEVEKAYVMTKEGGRGLGWGFVTFKCLEAAKKAREQKHTNLLGSRVKITQKETRNNIKKECKDSERNRSSTRGGASSVKSDSYSTGASARSSMGNMNYMTCEEKYEQFEPNTEHYNPNPCIPPYYNYVQYGPCNPPGCMPMANDSGSINPMFYQQPYTVNNPQYLPYGGMHPHLDQVGNMFPCPGGYTSQNSLLNQRLYEEEPVKKEVLKEHFLKRTNSSELKAERCFQNMNTVTSNDPLNDFYYSQYLQSTQKLSNSSCNSKGSSPNEPRNPLKESFKFNPCSSILSAFAEKDQHCQQNPQTTPVQPKKKKKACWFSLISKEDSDVEESETAKKCLKHLFGDSTDK